VRAPLHQLAIGDAGVITVLRIFYYGAWTNCCFIFLNDGKSLENKQFEKDANSKIMMF
jgi:hypothetical protein